VSNNIFVVMGLAEKMGIPLSSMSSLMKYKGIKPDQLTLANLSSMATDLGFMNPDEGGLGRLLTKLHADNPPDIIQWIGNDENMSELVSSLRGEETPFFHRCPYCSMISVVKTA